MNTFLAGTATGLALAAAWVFRKQLTEAPRVWREEPDENLNATARFVRKTVRKVVKAIDL